MGVICLHFHHISCLCHIYQRWPYYTPLNRIVQKKYKKSTANYYRTISVNPRQPVLSLSNGSVSKKNSVNPRLTRTVLSQLHKWGIEKCTCDRRRASVSKACFQSRTCRGHHAGEKPSAQSAINYFFVSSWSKICAICGEFFCPFFLTFVWISVKIPACLPVGKR